jgi:vitamin B12 transporter
MVTRLIRAAILLALAGGMCQASATPQVVVRGVVRDASGAAVPNASVYLRGADAFAVSGMDGHFELTSTTAPGDVTLVVVHAGFRAFEQRISLRSEPIALEVALEIESLAGHVEVTGRAADLEPAAAQKLATLDIYRTPGTDADPMRAVQMLPGVVKADEGAGLFVRGGDVSETATYLDRALLFHPYRYETPTGGFFGAVPPYLISGLSLSTGAFPARFGNALSGILELTGLDRPGQTAITATLGLGAASASVALPLGDHMGLRFSGNQTLSRLLFAVNPGDQHFQSYPSGSDLNLSFYADSATAGRFKISAFTNREQVGVEAQEDAFTGILDSASHNRLFSLNWEKPLQHWLIDATLSTGSYSESTRVGVLDLASRDSGERMRLDVSRSSSGWIFRSGVEAERLGTISQGTIATHGGDLGGVQGTRLWSLDLSEWRAGGYAELERSAGRFTTNIGVRLDRFQALRAWGADPRASVVYALRAKQRIRLAWGMYHQAPAPTYLNRVDGNPGLRPMHAQHLVAGYTYGEESGPLYLRVEGYAKEYGRLPLQDAVLNFNDRGNGFARGVDFFLKLAPSTRWQGWAGYSFLQARRLYTPYDDFQRYEIPVAKYRPDFDIPNTLQLVAQHSLTESVSVGASFRVASGKPFTPIVDSLATPEGFVPLYGAINSERLPRYERLDFSVSKSYSVAKKASMIVFLGVTNVMNRKNVFAYAYSADYSQRRPAEGSQGRAFYFGTSFQR